MNKNIRIAKQLLKIAKDLTAASSGGYEVYVNSSLYQVCWSGDVDLFLMTMRGKITETENACNFIAKCVKRDHDKFVDAMKKNGYPFIEAYNEIYFDEINGKVWVFMKGNLQDAQNNDAIQKVCDSIGLPVRFEQVL